MRCSSVVDVLNTRLKEQIREKKRGLQGLVDIIEALVQLPTEQNTKSMPLRNIWPRSSSSDKFDWTRVVLFPPARRSDGKISANSKYTLVTRWGLMISTVALLVSEKVCERCLSLKD